MRKKILACAILAACVNTGAMAGNFYVGPTLFAENISANQSSYRGMHPRMSLGYGDRMENYYLAGEIFAVPFSTPISYSTNSTGVNARISRSFGLSLLPGYMITDSVMGYLRLGVVNSKFSGPNTSKSGGQVGAGLETNLTSNWDLRGEYIYTAYQSVNGLGSAKSNEVGIGAVYKFDN